MHFFVFNLENVTPDRIGVCDKYEVCFDDLVLICSLVQSLQGERGHGCCCQF